MKTRKHVLLPLMLSAILIVGVACSSGIRDAERSSVDRGASGSSAGWLGPAGCESQTPSVAQYADHVARGYPYCNIAVNQWCNDAVSFYGLPDIGLCFVLENKTKKFTAPGRLDSSVPLTVVDAWCVPYRQTGNPDDGYLDDQGLCTNADYYRGSPRVYTTGSVFPQQARLLNPNPFMGTAAIQFMPHRQSTGPRVRLFVNSLMPPFNANQASAEPFGESPFSGTNGGDCDTQGRYFSCDVVGSIDTKSWNPKITYALGNYPLRLQITNSTGRPMTLQNQNVGSGLLLDPVALASVESIPAGGTAYIGGYLQANSSTAEMSWTGSYCIGALTGCVKADVTFRLKFVSDKEAVDSGARSYSNVSTCIIDNGTPSVTFKCNTPTWNNSVESPLITANVTNF